MCLWVCVENGGGANKSLSSFKVSVCLRVRELSNS